MSFALVFGALVLITDQVCKYLLLKYYPTIPTINRGLILGLSVNNSLTFWVILLLIMGVMIVLLRPKVKTINFYLGEVLIIFGILSNFIDRVTRGGVVDYLHIGKLIYFNLADLLIIMGLIIVCKKFVK